MVDTKGRKIRARYKRAAVEKYFSEKEFFFFNKVCRHISNAEYFDSMEMHLIFPGRNLTRISEALELMYLRYLLMAIRIFFGRSSQFLF